MAPELRQRDLAVRFEGEMQGSVTGMHRYGFASDGDIGIDRHLPVQPYLGVTPP